MSATQSRGMGRRPEPEPQMGRFPLMAAARGPFVRRGDYVRWPRFGGLLDQGNTGTCVGHAGEYALLTTPGRIKENRSPDTYPTAFDLYTIACDNDEWPENDGGRDLQFGSSVRGMARGLRAHGMIAAFHWAETVDAVADFIAGLDASGKRIGGGVQLGVNWYSSMFDTDAAGFIRITPTATIAGGHSIYMDEWNEVEGWGGGPNSWGRSFGRKVGGRLNGRWRMDGETLARLLREYGEACAYVELGRS